MKHILSAVQTLNTELVAYIDKPTKTRSKRLRLLLRLLLDQIKNTTPAIRAKLVELEAAD